MRVVVQRVSESSVSVEGTLVGQISHGLLVLLGVEREDTDGDLRYMVDKVSGLRIFDDEAGRMNRSVVDCGGSILVVSQFTLLGDVRRGKRPSFTSAAAPERANELYEDFCRELQRAGINVAQGRFQADMQVQLVNDGPVTILLDSRKLF